MSILKGLDRPNGDTVIPTPKVMDLRGVVVTPGWGALRDLLPTDIVDELEYHSRAKPTLAIRSFLHFVSERMCDEAESLKLFLIGDREGFDQPRGQTILLGAISAWTTQALTSDRWKQATIRAYRDQIFAAFGLAALKQGLKLPQVSSKSSRFPRISDTTPHHLLGTLDWPEFANVPPFERDACALNLIRSHGLRVFEAQERLFDFGQSVRGGSQPNERRWVGELDALKRLLDVEHESWSKSKRSIFSKPWDAAWSADVSLLANSQFWEHFGVPWHTTPDPLSSAYPTACGVLAADSVIGCLGPNFFTAQSMHAITATDVGWNRQPIQRLRSNPYIYRSGDFIRLGNERFMASFKERAGHYVVGSDTNSVARGLELDALDAVWDKLCSNPLFSDDRDYATVHSTSDLLNLMLRYERMTSSIRVFCDANTHGRYFIALSRAFKGGVRSPEYDLNKKLPEGPATREGATFSAVRKSHFVVYRRSGATTEEAREAAGQRSGEVNEKHYYDPAAVNSRIDAARFFQNCLQALIIDGRMAVKIDLTPDALEWFAHLATESGIRSACGLTPQLHSGELRPDFIFEPCRDNYIDLYLTHLALKAAKRRHHPRRWEVQGAYLYEMIIQIARILFEKGLRTDYKHAVKDVRLLVRAGAIALPPVMEV